jgi:hypothetical protein
MLDAHNGDKLQSGREDRKGLLRDMHINSGEALQCCNGFGESFDVYGMSKWKFRSCSSIRVKDEFGRSPFHDSCWAPSPMLELIHVLISQAQDLLLVPDVHGHTPFDYCQQGTLE